MGGDRMLRRTQLPLAMMRTRRQHTYSMPAANKLYSDQELAQRVAEWRRPWTPGPLSEEELEQFWEDGYVLQELFAAHELQPAIDAINTLVDELATRLYQEGKIDNRHETETFTTRLIKIEEQCPNASVWLHKQPFTMPREFQQLWAHPRLLDVAQQIIGPQIAGHPVWNLRTKVPQFKQATVPWHQDTAYLHEGSWTTLQPAAWLPLVDTDENNGCLRLAKGGHQSGRTAVHTNCWADTWYIDLQRDVAEKTLNLDMRPVEEGGDVVTIPVRKGEVLLFNNLIPHQSLENYSNGVRWSFDLRWQNPTQDSGFDGKPPILMRDPDQPGLQPDWETWAALNPFALRKSGDDTGNQSNDLDTTITGPWMSMWPVTNSNRHTDAHDRSLYDEEKWGLRTLETAQHDTQKRNSV